MNAIECCHAVETGAAETVSAMLDKISIQAQGRGKVMNEDYVELKSKISDFQSVAEKVIDKLSALTNLFEFFEYTKGMADFREKTIPGIYYIIDECIDQLGGIAK